MAQSYIPKSAQVIGELEVQRPDGVGRLTAYEGVASQGYHTNYTRVQTYWIRLEMPGVRVQQYSMTPGTFRKHVEASLQGLGAGPENGCTVLVQTGIYRT